MTTKLQPGILQDAEFETAARRVLRTGETVADLVDQSARAEVERRQADADFVARGLAALEEAERTGVWYSADEVHAELKAMLDAKLASLGK